MNFFYVIQAIFDKINFFLGIPINISQDRKRPKDRYRYNSLSIVFNIEKILNKCNLSFLNFKSILDFGCGWGRLLRIFVEFNGEEKVLGCDVNPYYVMSLNKHFRKSSIFQIPVKPPYYWPISKYDFIIAFSVFTHLT